MTLSTRNEPEDHRTVPLFPQGKAKASIRCGLCRETIELESNFRPTPAVCPHCGLKFTFDPQKQPLPVRGMRLNWSEVAAAQQRRGSDISHRRHDAHVSPQYVLPPAKSSWSRYLGWAGTLAIAAAGLLTLFSRLHR
jgi:hypothetical protein